MEQKNNNLNLARKYRPKIFADVVGQDIPIKMLLNSLYLEKLFPVYLFAGLRGCGKTSTARIFAAAINCKNIDNFKSNPKEFSVPCLNCESCKAALDGNHPDIIEIDAASHTGVENVRQILESCAYMPIMGRKKIYLIDEAHMLSKAAFNAFLKILEEPPVSALFILATTEIQKFPATVLSRCFQLIFKSIKNIDLKSHILKICAQETISIEEQAIDLLIQETEGSVRDALNMLERVRFSQEKISTNLLLKVLGKISEAEILDLLEIIIEENSTNLISIFSTKISDSIDPKILWDMIIQIIRALVWIKFKASNLPIYFNDKERLNNIASKISLAKLNYIFKLMWEQEDVFLKTTNKQIFLELLLLEMCQSKNKGTSSTNTNINSNVISNINKPAENILQNKETKIEPEQILSQNNNQITNTKNIDNLWIQFVEKINNAGNPFLSSVLSNAKFIQFNGISKKIELILANNNMFTQSTINDNKSIWQTILKEYYSAAMDFEFLESKNINPEAISNTQTINTKESTEYIKTNTQSTKENTNSIDSNRWPTTSLIQNFFPGKIKQGDETK